MSSPHWVPTHVAGVDQGSALTPTPPPRTPLDSSIGLSVSPSSGVLCRVLPLDMSGAGVGAGLSPAEAVQQVILAAKQKQQRKQQAPAAKPKRVRKDNSARAKRYREKKKSQVDGTLAEVEKLRAEVRELSSLRQVLAQKALVTPFASTGSPLRFVHAYFEVFRYGMQKPPEQRAVGERPNRNICGRRQEQYMRAFCREDVQFGASTGLAPAMAQWRIYSSLHPSLFLEFLEFRMDTVANCMLVSTTGVLHMRYTRATVATLFPHALAHEALVAKLVGQEVHLKYSDRWYFDEDGKVQRYELIPDMVQALYDVVGSLEAVSWLLSGGAVIPDRAHFDLDVMRRVELLDLDDDDDEGGGGGDSSAQSGGGSDPTPAAAVAESAQHGADVSMESPPPPQSPPQPAAMAIEFLLS